MVLGLIKVIVGSGVEKGVLGFRVDKGFTANQFHLSHTDGVMGIHQGWETQHTIVYLPPDIKPMLFCYSLAIPSVTMKLSFVCL